MRTLDASRVRRSFAEVVESVEERRDVVVIVRYGKPVAAIVPMARLTPTERRAVGPMAAATSGPARPRR